MNTGSSQIHPAARWLQINVLTAICYFVAGQAGLLLAVPPSNASPIWPPAGIALAVLLLYGPRALPGIVAGSYLVHLSAFLDTSTQQALQHTLLVGLGTSAGSAIQAWTGYALIKRFVAQPLTLAHERDILKFVLLGGLLASTVAASTGILTLLAAGAFPLAVAPLVWGTWWVGDTVGVIICTPLVLAFLGRPSESWRPRRVVLGLSLAVSLGLTIAFFNYATGQVHNRIESNFRQQAEHATSNLQSSLDEIERFLTLSRSFILSSENVTREEFTRFIDNGKDSIAHVGMLSWLTVDSQGRWAPALRKYIFARHCLATPPPPPSELDPDASNWQSEVLRQVDGDCPGLYIYSPVVAEMDTIDGQQRGMLVVAIDSEHLFDTTLDAGMPGDSTVSVSLNRDDGGTQAIYGNNPLPQQYKVTSAFRPSLATQLQLANRQLQITAVAGSDYVGRQYGWEAWAVLSGGLLFSSLLGMGLLLLTGRTSHTESLVEARTGELADEIVERRRTEHLLALQNSVLEMVARDEPLKEVLDSICVGFEKLSHDGTFASVMLVDPDKQVLHMTAGPSIPGDVYAALADLPIGQNQGSCGTAVYRGKQVTCCDIKHDCEWDKYREFALAHGLHACWSTPFFSKSGTILGSFALTQAAARSPNAYDQQHIRSATFLCSLAVEQSQANQQLNRLSLAVEQSPSAIVMTDLDGAIEYVNEHFCEQTGFTRSEAQGRIITDLMKSDLDPEELTHTWDELRRGQEWRGTLLNYHKDGSTYWAQCFITPVRDNHNEITHMVVIQDDVTELRESTEKITYQATHDLLTGLINRAEFETRLHSLLESARTHDKIHSLCLIDLDQFKIINDTDGHVAGDELLRQLGTMMRQHIRRNDVLARIGGDEFAILFEHCGIDKAVETAEKMRQLIAEHPFTWEKNTYNIGMSAGLVEISRDSPGKTELLREADAACYTAKETGRNQIRVFSPDDETTARRSSDMRWATRLREAIACNRLALYQQRIMSLTDDRHDSAEILVRMLGEDGQEIPPGAFLPAAERYDVIAELDAWVVRNTFAHLAANPDFLQSRQYCSINLSGRSLRQDFAMTLIDWLEEFQLPENHIVFEITETAAIGNLSQAIGFMETLNARGVLFALDDFGSGLSSFAYLKNLPVDILKIDGQFVRDILRDPVDLAMVKAINEIGKVLNKRTIAEFVESNAMLATLREMGVDCVQGYAIARPQPLEQKPAMQIHGQAS